MTLSPKNNTKNALPSQYQYYLQYPATILFSHPAGLNIVYIFIYNLSLFNEHSVWKYLFQKILQPPPPPGD